MPLWHPALFFVEKYRKKSLCLWNQIMTKWSVKADKSIDLRVVPEIATALVQHSILRSKRDAEDLHAIAKRADPRSAAHNSFDNGEMRCVRIFELGVLRRCEAASADTQRTQRQLQPGVPAMQPAWRYAKAKRARPNNMVILRITVK